MKLFKILLLQILFILIYHLSANAQTDGSVLTQIINKTAKLYNNYPIEKVYLHFDKPYYAVGDTMWFKAYLTLDHHQPPRFIIERTLNNGLFYSKWQDFRYSIKDEPQQTTAGCAANEIWR